MEEYEDRKGVALTSAKRLGDFLGNEIIQGKGLNCYFIVAQKPIGFPVSQRAIPVSIFNAEESIKVKYLKKWLKESEIKDTDMRKIIDWDYYIQRLQNTIQKMLVIPAALQKIKNPAPRVPYPDWLSRALSD
jgi:DNA polymerase epsilon subunit 1